MYDSVGGFDVGRRHVHRAVQHDSTIRDFDGDLRSQERTHRIDEHDVFSQQDLSRGVVEQDVCELSFRIRQQGVQRAFGQCLKGSVGGREDGERPVTVQRLRQSGCDHSGLQRGEGVILDHDVGDRRRWR